MARAAADAADVLGIESIFVHCSGVNEIGEFYPMSGQFPVVALEKLREMMEAVPALPRQCVQDPSRLCMCPAELPEID